jgi:hypothetical protein
MTSANAYMKVIEDQCRRRFALRDHQLHPNDNGILAPEGAMDGKNESAAKKARTDSNTDHSSISSRRHDDNEWEASQHLIDVYSGDTHHRPLLARASVPLSFASVITIGPTYADKSIDDPSHPAWLGSTPSPALPGFLFGVPPVTTAKAPKVNILPLDTPSICDEISFAKQWDTRSQGIFRSFNWSNVCVAGGSILHCIMAPLDVNNPGN